MYIWKSTGSIRERLYTYTSANKIYDIKKNNYYLYIHMFISTIQITHYRLLFTYCFYTLFYILGAYLDLEA